MPNNDPSNPPTAEDKEPIPNEFFFGLRQMRTHQQAVKATLDEALTIITHGIREHWSTGGGTRLRQIVWSLWNGNTILGLFHVLNGLDYRLACAVAKLLEASLVGALDSDNYLRRVLTDSGEFARYDAAAKATPEGEDVIYPPLPISAESLRDLAVAATAKAARIEAECRAEEARMR